MKIQCATPVGLGRTVLAAAIALVLSSPVYATDPAPTSSPAAVDRAAAAADRAIAAGDRAEAAGDRAAAAVDRDTAGSTKPADNTAHNSRDADGNELTPLDQSHAAADVEITRSIPKLLVDDDTLGTNAQNVKVITVDGLVTLRGPVANADEQSRIVGIARQAAGADRVVNELTLAKR